MTQNKKWDKLFEGTATPNLLSITEQKYGKILLPLEKSEKEIKPKVETETKSPVPIKVENNVIDGNVEDKPPILASHSEKPVEVPKQLDIVPSPIQKPTTPVEIKKEIHDDKEPELTVEQIIEIQKKVKAKEVAPPQPSPPTTSSHVSLPVTVIVGSPTSTTKPDGNGNSSSSSQIQIKQPHTTITVHQTTIHPQMSPKNSNPIQITNQIQIQQITVQPNGSRGTSNNSEIQYNIKQGESGQEIQIQSSPRRSDITVEDYTKGVKRPYSIDEFNIKKTQSLRHVRVTKDFNGRRTSNDSGDGATQKENIPMLLKQRMTTITPIMNGAATASSNVVTAGKRKDSPEVIDLDSDGENPHQTKSSTKSCPVKKRKLEILREGGLEVTPIHSSNPPISQPIRHMIPEITTIPIMSSKVTKSDTNRSTFMNPPPKTSHLLVPSSSRSDQKPSVSPKPPIKLTQTPNHIPPPLFQSGCMYTKSTKIFGNPKDTYPPPPETIHNRGVVPKASSQSQSSQEKLLDLTFRKSAPISYTKSIDIVKIPVVQKQNRINLPPAMHPPIQHNTPPQQPLNLNHNFRPNVSATTVGNYSQSRERISQPPNITISRPVKQPPVRDNHKSKSAGTIQPTTHVQNIHNSQNYNINRKKQYEPEKPRKLPPTSTPPFPTHYTPQSSYHPPSPHIPTPHAPQQPPPQQQSHAVPPQASPNTPTKPAPPFPLNMLPPHPAAYLPSLPHHPSSSSAPSAAAASSALAAAHHARQMNQMNQFLPLLDPIYMSALYANQGLPMFPPQLTPELLQYYTKSLAQGMIPITKS